MENMPLYKISKYDDEIEDGINEYFADKKQYIASIRSFSEKINDFNKFLYKEMRSINNNIRSIFNSFDIDRKSIDYILIKLIDLESRAVNYITIKLKKLGFTINYSSEFLIILEFNENIFNLIKSNADIINLLTEMKNYLENLFLKKIDFLKRYCQRISLTTKNVSDDYDDYDYKEHTKFAPPLMGEIKIIFDGSEYTSKNLYSNTKKPLDDNDILTILKAKNYINKVLGETSINNDNLDVNEHRLIINIIELLKQKGLSNEDMRTHIHNFIQNNYLIMVSNKQLYDNIVFLIKKNNINDLIKILNSYRVLSNDINYSSFTPTLFSILKKTNCDRNKANLIAKNITPLLNVKLNDLMKGSPLLISNFFKCFYDKDISLIIKSLYLLSSDIMTVYGTYNILNEQAWEFISRYFSKIKNLDAFAKIINIFIISRSILHSVGADNQVGELFSIIIENNIDITSDLIIKIIKLSFDKKFEKTVSFNNLNPNLIKDKLNIDIQDLKENFHSIKQDFFNGNLKNLNSASHLKEKVLKTYADMESILSFSSISKFFEKAIPKNTMLFKLNYRINNDDYFKVLNDLDINHFKIGSQTDCCQSIGAAGENAAIDSFINPLAGVLVLYHSGEVVAQSYFHYIPKDHGIILDNVEVNQNNIKKYNIPLDDYYAALAAFASKDLNLKYFRCGLDYNKLSSSKFKKSKLLKDNRDFKHGKYSDFSHKNHLDLLQPNDPITVNLTKLDTSVMSVASSIVQSLLYIK